MRRIHINSPRPQECALDTSTPLQNSKGKPKTMTTPCTFILFFFDQNNAESNSIILINAELKFLFNITLIIEQLLRESAHFIFFSGKGNQRGSNYIDSQFAKLFSEYSLTANVRLKLGTKSSNRTN